MAQPMTIGRIRQHQSVQRAMDSDVQELQDILRELEHDLQAFEDVRQLKSWLKDYRIETSDDFDIELLFRD